MIDDSTGQTSAAPDIVKRQKALKVKIYDWKKKGYNVTRFLDLLKEDILVAEEEFATFLMKVAHLAKLEEKLYHLDTQGFEDQVKRIESRIKEPESIGEIEQEIILLEEAIVRKKIDSSGATGVQAESTLQRELQRIRQEELKRIRSEESELLREQERKKILNEELTRIREEERERLKKTELERIRKEEKERIVWEDRVVHQLRQAKDRQKEEASRKKMKCPACSGSITITSEDRPLKVRCPDCGKDYTLRAKGEERSGKGTGMGKMQYKKCPKCSSPIPIVSEARPLKIICQMCNAEYMLKAKKGDNAGGIAGSPGTGANQTLPFKQKRSSGLDVKDYDSHQFSAGVSSITCQTCDREIPGDARICGYCGSPVDHSELAKKQNQALTCQNCGKGLPDDARICGYCGSPVSAPGGPPSTPSIDDFELPLSPNEQIRDDFETKKTFKPLNDFSFPMDSDLSGPGVAPPGSMEKYGSHDEGIACPKCGNHVPRGAKFCGVCGNIM